jgi:predicted Zn-dependent protease
MVSHPKDKVFLRALGDNAMQTRSYPAADQHYSALIKIDPNDAAALNNLAWLSARLGKPGALGFAERAVALDQNNMAFVDTLAHVLLDDKQIPRATELAKRVAQASSSDPVLLLSATDVLVRAGETKLAEVELDKLSKLPPNAFVQSEVKRLRALSAR